MECASHACARVDGSIAPALQSVDSMYVYRIFSLLRAVKICVERWLE